MSMNKSGDTIGNRIVSYLLNSICWITWLSILLWNALFIISLLNGRNMFHISEKFTLLFTNMMNASWLLLNVICRGKMFPRAILTTCLWSALIIFRLMIIKHVWSSQHHIPLIPYIPLLLPLCVDKWAYIFVSFQCGVVLINRHVHQHTLWHWDKCAHFVRKLLSQ